MSAAEAVGAEPIEILLVEDFWLTIVRLPQGAAAAG